MRTQSRVFAFALLCFSGLIMIGIGVMMCITHRTFGQVLSGVQTANNGNQIVAVGVLQMLLGVAMIGIGYTKFILGIGLRSHGSSPLGRQQVPRHLVIRLATSLLVLIGLAVYMASKGR